MAKRRRKKEQHLEIRKAMEIIIIALYAVGIIPVLSLVFYPTFFWIITGASILAYILSQQANDKYTANKDLLNIIFSVIALIPFIGIILKIIGIIFASQALQKLNRSS